MARRFRNIPLLSGQDLRPSVEALIDAVGFIAGQTQEVVQPLVASQATMPDVINKLNELIVRIQGLTPVTAQDRKTPLFPIFSAYHSSIISVPNNAFTKIPLQTKEFDTMNSFDAATNYRFQPMVPGYYQLSASVYFTGPAATVLCSFFKNEGEYKRGTQSGSAANAGWAAAVSACVYLNGTTDYIDLRGYQSSGAALATFAGIAYTFMTGHLVWS